MFEVIWLLSKGTLGKEKYPILRTRTLTKAVNSQPISLGDRFVVARFRNIDKKHWIFSTNLATRWLEIALRMHGIMNGEVRFHLLNIPCHIQHSIQWRIQDFPQVGREPSRWHRIMTNFSQNCMEFERIWTPMLSCIPINYPEFYPIFSKMPSSLKDQFCLKLRIRLILSSLNCISVVSPRILMYKSKLVEFQLGFCEFLVKYRASMKINCKILLLAVTLSTNHQVSTLNSPDPHLETFTTKTVTFWYSLEYDKRIWGEIWIEQHTVTARKPIGLYAEIFSIDSTVIIVQKAMFGWYLCRNHHTGMIFFQKKKWTTNWNATWPYFCTSESGVESRPIENWNAV